MLVKQLKVILKAIVCKYFYPLLPDPKVKVVIVSSARSGSNYLVSLLASHPDIYQYGEVIGDSYMRRKEFQSLLRMCGTERYVKDCYKKRFFKKVVGIKILYYQFKQYFGEKWGVHDVPDVLESIHQDTEIKVIHLKRKNLLKILVSNEIARKTGEYVIRDSGRKSRDESVALSPEKCRHFFESMEKTKAEFDDRFQDHDKFEIYYRDLVSNKNGIRQKLLKFLGVKPSLLKSNTFKQNQRPLSERIVNYNELKSHFQNTRWNNFFED